MRDKIGAGYYGYDEETKVVKFSEHGHNHPGDDTAPSLEDLADLLSNLPQVKPCMVRSIWNKIFGYAARLNATELDAATEYFSSNTDFRGLLKHLLTTDKAKTYFTAPNGPTEVEQAVAAEANALNCDAANKAWNEYAGTDTDIASKGKQIATGVCNTKLFTDGGNIEPEPTTDIGYIIGSIYNRINGISLPIMSPARPDVKVHGDIANLDNALNVQHKVFSCFIESEASAKGITLPDLSQGSSDNIAESIAMKKRIV